MSVKNPEELGHWKSVEAEAEFRRLVDELVDETWTTRLASSVLDTGYGRIVVHSAPGGGAPVVVLPGWGAPAHMFVPELLAGLGGRPYHLVETPGDVGPSVQTAPIEDADDERAWLTEVLDRLGLDRAHLVGSSLGGYRAMNLALRSPDRVLSVSGVEPATARPGGRFLRHGVVVLFASLTPRPMRRRLAGRLHMPGLDDKRLTKIGRLSYTKHVSGHPRPEWLTDAQLAAIAAPTLVLLGVDSELHDAEAVGRRLRATMPDVRVQLMADAGHSLPIERPEAVGRAVGEFLDAVERSAGPSSAERAPARTHPDRPAAPGQPSH